MIVFVGLNKNFTQPITQISMQINFSRSLLPPPVPPVSLILWIKSRNGTRAMWSWSTPRRTANGSLWSAKQRTNVWAWKHPHHADGTVTYTRLGGGVVFDDVDFGYDEG